MRRRQFLKQLTAGGAAFGLTGGHVFAAPEDYTGRFFVTIQVDGAWDVSSFCDPKMNQSGERTINQWAKKGEIEEAGNIRYAPVANNRDFFRKYYRDMLVINGIDAQTNSHSTGVLHNWSGRNSAGYPSLTALHALANAPDLPLAYMNFGGYAETARLIRYTRLKNIGSMLSVLSPNALSWDRERNIRDPEMLSIVQRRQQERLQRLRQRETLLPRQEYTMDAYYDARRNASKLADLSAYIPPKDELEGEVRVNSDVTSDLRAQAQIALLAFKAGVGCSADLHLGGFDTHANHDQQHYPLLGHLTDSIDYFWNYASSLGIADRVTLMVTSDFARTPYYNSGNGKDHWPIGSALFMEQGASWGNRQINATDELQNALTVAPDNLRQTTEGGTRIYPKHVHHAVRQYLGLSGGALENSFPLHNTPLLPFFA